MHSLLIQVLANVRLADGISELDAKLNPYLMQQEDSEARVDDAEQTYKDSVDERKQALKELKKMQKEAATLQKKIDNAQERGRDCEEEEEEYAELLECLQTVQNEVEVLKTVVATNKAALDRCKHDHEMWTEANAPAMESLEGKIDRLQKPLKALCSAVRNEYSKQSLQNDFR